MPHFFYPIDGSLFSQRLQPILARCRREKSFAPGKDLFDELLPFIHDFHASYHGLAGKSLVEQAGQGLSFDVPTWKAVVGEVLLFAADELPLLHISPRSLCCLLAVRKDVLSEDQPRAQFGPIEQVLFGSRDLVFAGSYYRPDVVGCNDSDDVARLAEFLRLVDPAEWQPGDLAAMKDLPDEEERNEELEFVRQNWPSLTELYDRARRQRHMIVCERE